MNKHTLNILQVVNSLAIGGLEKVAINIVNNQPKQEEINFSILCLEEKGALVDFVKPSIEIFELDKNNKPYLQLIREFAQIVKKNKIDIIHCHNYAPLLFSVLVKILLLGKVKIVYTEHNQIYSISEKHYKRFRYLLKLADAIVTVSKNLQTHFIEEKLGKKSTVIWNGITTPKFDSQEVARINKQYRNNQADFIIGTAVVMSEQKGLKYLIEAAKQIIDKYPEIKFMLIGDGYLKNELENQVRYLKLESNFYFPGYKKDIPNYIKTMDVFIMPSLWEGFSIALLEANALGIPIITTDVGGNSEIIKNEINGLLVPAKDPGALVKAVSNLFLDRGLREQFAENGKKLFKENFEVSKMVKNYNDTYYKLMKT